MKNNYPTLMQSEERNAPWNQEELQPIEVDCSVCYCMSKSMPVQVLNYETSEDVSGSFYDEGTKHFFDNTNFIEEFKNDNNAIGIPTLLYELQELCKEKITKIEDKLNKTNNYELLSKDLKHYKKILKAAKDWIVDDLDVIKE